MLSTKMNNIVKFLSRRGFLSNQLSSLSTSASKFSAQNDGDRRLNEHLGEDFDEFERNLSYPVRSYNRSEKRPTTTTINNSIDYSNRSSNADDFALLLRASRDPSYVPKFMENFDKWWFNFYNRLMDTGPGRVSYVVRSLGQVNKNTNGILRSRVNRSLIRSLETQFVLAEDSSIKLWYFKQFLVGLEYLQSSNDFYAAGGYPSKQFVSKLVKFFKNDAADQSCTPEMRDLSFCECILRLSMFRVYPDAEDLNFVVEKMKLLMQSWHSRFAKVVTLIEHADIGADGIISGDGYLNENEIVAETLRFLIIHNEMASTFINWNLDPDQCAGQSGQQQQRAASFWRLWFKNAKLAFTVSSMEKFHSIMRHFIDNFNDRAYLRLDNACINGLLLCLGANCACVAEQYNRLPELFDVEHSIGQTYLQIFPNFQKNSSSGNADDRNSLKAPFYATTALEVAFRRCETKIRAQTLLMKPKKTTNDKHAFTGSMNDDVHLLKGDRVFLRLSTRIRRWEENMRSGHGLNGNEPTLRRVDQMWRILTCGNVECFGAIFSIYYSKANNILARMMGHTKKKRPGNKIDPLSAELDGLLDDEESEIFATRETGTPNIVAESDPIVDNVDPETKIDDLIADDDPNFAYEAPVRRTVTSNRTHNEISAVKNLGSTNALDLDQSPEAEALDHAEVSNTDGSSRSEGFIEDQYFKDVTKNLNDEEESTTSLRDQAKNVTEEIFVDFGKKFEETVSRKK